MQIAILVPCYNEEQSIAHVVAGFRKALPSADIYVYDNNSSDRTVDVAARAGAIVRHEAQQGKGHVVRRMFSDVDADIYILIDGDNTYDAAAAPAMVALLVSGPLDMVNGVRMTTIKTAYRPGHRFGNWMLTSLVTAIFGRRTRDMLSGYRVFSRRYVKSFPALSRGFEIETELTVHALELNMPMADMDTAYVDRAPGSVSKLNTVRDGLRILRMIVSLIKEDRPLYFFSLIALALAVAAVALAYPLAVEFAATGLVPRLPTAILASAVMIVAILAFFAGLILDTVTHGRREMKRLFYLGQRPVGDRDGAGG